MIEQKQINAFDEIRGESGSHYDLAKKVESIGLVVEMDPDNNERSEVVLSGVFNRDGSNIVIGEIVGDSEAKII